MHLSCVHEVLGPPLFFLRIAGLVHAVRKSSFKLSGVGWRLESFQSSFCRPQNPASTE